MKVDRFLEPIVNGIATVIYGWMAIALVAAPFVLDVIKNAEGYVGLLVGLVTGIIGGITLLALAAKIGLMKPNHFINDALVMPLAILFVLGLYVPPYS
jgi:hypothetical protein